MNRMVGEGFIIKRSADLQVCDTAGLKSCTAKVTTTTGKNIRGQAVAGVQVIDNTTYNFP